MGAADLHIAEVVDDSGQVRQRYSRYRSADRTVWIRHGLFRAYHADGVLASEGHYRHGCEHGIWRDFHESGRPAAEGRYEDGDQVAGTWCCWDDEDDAEPAP